MGMSCLNQTKNKPLRIVKRVFLQQKSQSSSAGTRKLLSNLRATCQVFSAFCSYLTSNNVKSFFFPSEHIAFPKSTVQSRLPRPLLSEQQMPLFLLAPPLLIPPHPPSSRAQLDGSALPQSTLPLRLLRRGDWFVYRTPLTFDMIR